MPRDFYVKPQFLAQSDAYLQLVTAIVGKYNQSVDGGLSDDAINQVISQYSLSSHESLSF